MYLLTRWNSNKFIFQLDTKVCASSLSIYLIQVKGKKKFLPTLITMIFTGTCGTHLTVPPMTALRVPQTPNRARATTVTKISGPSGILQNCPRVTRFITMLFKVSVAMLHTWTLYETEWRVRELKPSEVQNLNNNKILFKNAIYGFLLGI